MAGGSSSKNKGNSGERELCKFLGELFDGSFIRSANSGAFVGGFHAARMAKLSKTQIAGQRGDIIPPDFMPKLILESKFYKDFRFHQLMQPGPQLVLDEWIGQVNACRTPGELALVCFKINLRGTYVAVPEEVCGELVFGNHCRYEGKHGAYRVTDLKSFMTTNREKILELSA